MPAIEFSRLRTKIELLGRVYDQPGQFVKDLSDLYFFYSDLTFQFGSAYDRSNAHPAYRAPVVINRELEHALQPKASSHPEETLKIVDALWVTMIFEPCQLAAALLGMLPIQFVDAIFERIESWSQQQDENPELISILHNKGTATIRRERPDLWLKTLEKWYHSKDRSLHKLSLLGLLPMINDPDFENLPILFDFLQPILINPDSHLVFTLLSILEKLSQRSESETVYFLKQIIKESTSKDLPRFIRRALPSFSEEAQLSLKACLRENS